MFKLFDRYILKEISPPFLLGLLIYSFVLLMNQLLQLPALFIAKGVSLGVTLKLLFYLVPGILAFTVPMSVLMGILAGLSRLSSDSEITAFKNLGISPRRMLRPLLVFAFGGWLLTSVLTLYLAPFFNFKWVQTLTESVLDKVQLQINPREFFEGIPNTVIFIQDIVEQKDWRNILIYLSDTPEKPRLVVARRGRLNFYPKARRATLELYEVLEHANAHANPDDYTVTSTARMEQEIDIESLYATFSAEQRVREKNIQELFTGLRTIEQDLQKLEKEKAEIVRKKLRKDDMTRVRNEFALLRAENERRSHKVEIHKKFALPFVCWIFVFLGLPLGVSTKKGGRTSGFTLSLVIILVYYVCITAGEKFALEERMSPFLGMWGGNILFGLLSLILFFRYAKESPLFSLFGGRGRGLLRRMTARTKKGRGWRWPRPSLPFPNILDRYIIRRYLVIASLVILSLISIFVIITFFDRLGILYEHRKPMSMLLGYIRFRIPEFIHYSLPMTALTATLLTLGLFTKSNEVTAMKACGISIYRAVLPAVFLAGLIGWLAFHIQERVLPQANKKAKEIWNKITDVSPRSYGYLNRRWVANKKRDRFYHYSYFDPEKSAFSWLSIFDLDLSSWSLKRRIYAERAVLKEDLLHLENGWIREFTGEAPKSPRAEVFKTMDLTLEEGRASFLKEWREPSQMTYGELRQYVREIKELGFETVGFRVDLSSKISFPFVALIMTLLGIPFAFSMGKRGTLVGIGVSLAIAMVYWVAIGVFRSLGYIGFLNVFFAAWGPNLVFGLIGLYLLFRLRT
jgi:LPS export ABC transporter permease LptG/LPS export ABC transporter permease LptF